MRASSRRDEHWEARTIGEDGLPRQRSRLIVYEPCDRERGRIGCVCPRCELEQSVAESNATKLTEAAVPRQCAMCGKPTKEGDGTVVDLLVDAENRLRELPSVEEAHMIVEFILHRTAGLLSPPQFAEYVQGVKAIAKTITEALGTDRGVSLIGTIGWAHAADIMRER